MKTWHAGRQCCRNLRPLACRERFPVAGPGKAHGRPRTALFVLACTNWTLVGTDAACEPRERVVSVAPHMPEMGAEVATVTLHRSFSRLETAKPSAERRAPAGWLVARSSAALSPARNFYGEIEINLCLCLNRVSSASCLCFFCGGFHKKSK